MCQTEPFALHAATTVMSASALSRLISANPRSMHSIPVSQYPSIPHPMAIAKLPQPSHSHPLFSSSPLSLSYTINGVPSYPSSSLLLSAQKSPPFLISSAKIASFRVLSASLPEAKGDEPIKPAGLLQTLQLGAMFGTWYLLNIYFNIYNKQVLHLCPSF